MHHIVPSEGAKRCSAKSPENCPYYNGSLNEQHYADADAANAEVERRASYKNAENASLSNKEPWTMRLESMDQINAEIAKVMKMAEERDENALNEYIDSRVNSKKQKKAIAALERLHKEETQIKEEYDQAKELLRRSNLKRNPVILTPDEHALYSHMTSAVGIRERDALLRERYENRKALENQLNQYRSVAGIAAREVSILREQRERESGTFLTYDKDHIGILKSEGAYEPNSPEWHAARARGIGGSDVGTIMKVDKTYAEKNYNDMLKAKLGMPVEQPETGDETAIGRGNNWEEKIRQMYADKNPDRNVAFSKDSWVGEGEQSHLKANFDGLELDDDGNAIGIVEIKTGRTYDGKWGDVEDGIDGVPKQYALQTIYYAKNGGMNQGTIVALLNDNDYREYRFSMDDPRVKKMADDIDKNVDTFKDVLEKKKADHAAGKDIFATNARKGIPKSHDVSKITDQYMLYTGMGEHRRAEAETMVKNAMKENGHDGVRSLYASYDPAKDGRDVPMVGIDIETSGLSPSTGRIIESAVIEYKPDGSKEVLYKSLYDVPERAHKGAGLGATDVHNITNDMVKGQPVFEDPVEQEKLMSALNGKVIVAHNARFENSFLSSHLAGFAEATDRGDVKFLDTMNLTSHLMVNTDNNTMKSFTEGNGVKYEEAHRADKDTDMMMKALWKMQTGRGYKIDS